MLNVFHHPSVICRLFSKTLDSFVLQNISFTFPSVTFYSEIVFGFGWIFQKSFVHHCQTWYLLGLHIWTVRWPLFILNHLQRVCVQALLSNTCSVCRIPCIAVNLTGVSCNLQYTLEAEINKQLQLLSAKTLPLKLHYSDVIVMSSWFNFLLK